MESDGGVECSHPAYGHDYVCNMIVHSAPQMCMRIHSVHNA